MAATTQNPTGIFSLGASDGKSLGYRPLETAQRLVANGFAKPLYGRKGHLNAIWLRREDGTSPVQRANPEWGSERLLSISFALSEGVLNFV